MFKIATVVHSRHPSPKGNEIKKNMLNSVKYNIFEKKKKEKKNCLFPEQGTSEKGEWPIIKYKQSFSFPSPPINLSPALSYGNFAGFFSPLPKHED
jgi:hypothetical protein